MTACPSPAPASETPAPHQRVRGRAEVALAARAPRPARLRQEGAGRAFVLAGRGGVAEVVFLNTAGGLTAGDRLALALAVPAGGCATGTTQTAERLYRAEGGRAGIDVACTVGAGGHLDWLPQETILFEGSAADRRTAIDLAPGASCLAVETLVLGRAAMGERLTRLDLHDRREIRQGGRPVHVEALHLTGAHLLAPPGSGRDGRVALLAGARAAASLVLVAPGAADALGPVRAELDEPGVAGAASAPAWPEGGRLVVRLMAADGWPLRRQLARLLLRLRRAPLPRVWQV